LIASRRFITGRPQRKASALGGFQVPEAIANLVYACDQWEIDLGRRELRSRGIPVPLGGRAFEIVTILVQSPNGFVSKDDLMERVWPGATVGEGTIHVHISAVRKALGPDRGLLKTASGRGYRLLGSWTPQQREGTALPLYSPLTGTSGTPSANNFPPLINRLVGRAAACQFVRDLVSAYRVVTLTGPGGIGKTALAVKAVRYLLPEFEDGGWLVELAALSDPGLVPSTVASTLGLKLSGEISAESVARAVGGRHLVLVLDNCEHVIDAVANLAETLTRLCPRTTIVATSREVLRIDGEAAYRVPPLDVPAPGQAAPDYIMQYSAVELFVARIKALNAGFSPTAGNLVSIATICGRLDGIPLAIEFAAARAAVLSVQGVATGLHDRFGLLTAGRRTALPRHRTLRATFDWSHELLPDEERQLLRRLGVFAGGFTIDAATAVMTDAGFDAVMVTECIANLVTKSLIALDPTPGATRWYLLETIRAYALQKLAESGESDDVQIRQAVYFRDLFTPPASGAKSSLSDEDLARHVREIDNLRAALDWAYGDRGDPTLAVALTAAATPVWIHLLLIDECKERIEQAISLIAEGVVPRDARRDLRLFSSLATAHMHSTGDALKIDDAWSRVADLAEELDDGEYRLRGLWGLWLGRYFNRDFRGALQAATRLATLPDGAMGAADRFVGERILGVTLHILGDQTRARVHIENMLRGYVAPPGEVHIQRYHFDQNVAARRFMPRCSGSWDFPIRQWPLATAPLMMR
jgi:predicted ATPase/DNA-binding winged helix-turn-helix (wHTH) protein